MSFDTDSGGLFTSVGIAQVEDIHGVDAVHERTRIREFYAGALRAVLIDPERVHSDPKVAIQGRPAQFELPALNITTRSDATEPYYKLESDEHVTKHTLEIGVDIYGSETDDVDVARLLDAIALGVETVLLDDTGRPESIVDVLLDDTSPAMNADGTRRFGVASMTFTVTYTT